MKIFYKKKICSKKKKHIIHLELAEGFRDNLASLEYIEHEIAKKKQKRNHLMNV